MRAGARRRRVPFQTAHFPGSFYPRAMQLGKMSAESRFPDSTLAELRARPFG
ncbi:hypothetical protein VSR82_16625 [Burkholderia sp. JPY481]|uniref:hypothetical protein n=1 Tax=unclassified Paraburkholderia TaxID=2615204 RepID=UPI00316EFC53